MFLTDYIDCVINCAFNNNLYCFYYLLLPECALFLRKAISRLEITHSWS